MLEFIPMKDVLKTLANALIGWRKSKTEDTRHKEILSQMEKSNTFKGKQLKTTKKAARNKKYAERKKRFSQEVNNLNQNNHNIQLSSVRSLTALADEWSADKYATQLDIQTNVQQIIEALCDYIRSPFTLLNNFDQLQLDAAPYSYGGNFQNDKALFLHEQTLRRTIFEEIGKRFYRNPYTNLADGPWKNYKFNFYGSHIFYKMNNLSLKEINLDDLNFYGNIDFSGTSFFGDFNSSGTVENYINFKDAHFHDTASFTGSHFKNGSAFSGAKFYISAYFDDTHFYENNNFNDLKLEKDSIASFKNAWFDQKAKFERAQLNGLEVDFSGAIFNMGVDFMNANDTAKLIFKDSLFNGKLTQFFVEDEIAYTHLLVNSFHTVHSSITMGFTPDSGTLWPNNALPVGSRWFNPESWDNSQGVFHDVSKPAKPLENSDTEEEKPSK